MLIGSILKKRTFSALVALFLTLAPFIFVSVALAQTEPPGPGADLPVDPGAGNLSQGAASTRETVPDSPYADAQGEVPLVYQQASNNTQTVIQNVTDQLLGTELGYINETYMGMKRFWGDDIIGNLFQNIGQLIGKWISEWINGWVAQTVQFLSAFLRTFVLNPNIAVNGIQNGPGAGQSDDISPYIRAAADVMYGIAVDLLLLLFILCIWKFWAETAWRGGASLMSAVGRLIVTAGLLLAWPTMYAFWIQISNEMIQAIYFNSADQILMLDAALASAVKGGLMAGAGLLAHAFAPVIGGAVGGLIPGLVGEVVAFAGLVIYLILGGILIAQLIYILVLKAIQTALLTAQYMFGPIFLVFFATPDTENVATGYVRSFVEVSLWTFVWVGLLKIMVIILFSDFNPWGKIVMVIGVLQLMIQVPSFLARAQISPMSDFISAGLITGGVLGLGKALASKGGDLMDRFAKWRGQLQDGGARGAQQTQSVKLNGLPHGVQDPEALRRDRKAAGGELENEKNKNGLNPHDPNNPNKLNAQQRQQQQAQQNKQGAEGLKTNPGANPDDPSTTQGKKLDQNGQPTAQEGPKAKGKDGAGSVADALGTGLKGAGVAGALGGLMAGAQAADAMKNKQGQPTTNPLDPQSRAAQDLARMWGGDPDALAGAQNKDKGDKTDKTDKGAAQQTKPVDSRISVNPDEHDKEKQDLSQVPTPPPTAKGKEGEGEKKEAQQGGQAPKVTDPKLAVNAVPVPGGPRKPSEQKDKQEIPTPPDAKKGTTTGDKTSTTEPPKTQAVDAQGKPVKVTSTGDGSGQEKGRDVIDTEQEQDPTKAGLQPGQRDMTLRVNEKDPQNKGQTTGTPKLSVEDGKKGTTTAGAQNKPGEVPTPPQQGVKPGQTPGTQNPNLKTTETGKGPTDPNQTQTQEQELQTIGQSTDGRDMHVRQRNTEIDQTGRGGTGRIMVDSIKGGDSKLQAAGSTPLQQQPGTTIQAGGQQFTKVGQTADGKPVFASQSQIVGTGSDGQPILQENAALYTLDSQGGQQSLAPVGRQQVIQTGQQSSASAPRATIDQGQPTPAMASPQSSPTSQPTSFQAAGQQFTQVGRTADGRAVFANQSQIVGVSNDGQPILADNVSLYTVEQQGGQASLTPVARQQLVQGSQQQASSRAAVDQGQLQGQLPQGVQPPAPGAGSPATIQAGGQQFTQVGRTQDGRAVFASQSQIVSVNNDGQPVLAENAALYTVESTQSGGSVLSPVTRQQIVQGTQAAHRGAFDAGHAPQIQPQLQGAGAQPMQVQAGGQQFIQVGQMPDGRPVFANQAQIVQAGVGSDGQPVMANSGGLYVLDQGGASLAPMTGQQIVQAAQHQPLRFGNAGVVAQPGVVTPIAAARTNVGQAQMATAVAQGGITQGSNPDMTTTSTPAALQEFEPDPLADGKGPTKVNPFQAFDHQAGYGGVPPAIMAIAIRTYQGPSMGKSPDGKPTIVGTPRGISHVRFGENATPEQQAMQIAAAGYAATMSDDYEAMDAARQSAIDSGAERPRGMADRIAANWMQYRGSSWRETYRAKRQFQQAMTQAAVEGAQAYVTGDEEHANAFTEHLRTRFGDMTPEKQAFLVHTLTDNTSPESGWSTARVPATEALVAANMPISWTNRAVMARLIGSNLSPWQRAMAAKGMSNYVDAVIDARAGAGTTPEERGALAGYIGPRLPQAIVDTCATIQQLDATPEETCRDIGFVQAVARRGAGYVAKGDVREPYKQAYQEELLNHRYGFNGGGGGTTYVSGGGGSSPPPPPPSGGPPPVVTTSVQGSIIGAGGGDHQTIAYDQVVDVSREPVSMAPQANLSMPTPQISAPQVRQQANLSFRVANPPPMRGPAQGGITIQGAGGNLQASQSIASANIPSAPAEQQVFTDVEGVIVHDTPKGAPPPSHIPLDGISKGQAPHVTHMLNVSIKHAKLPPIHGEKIQVTLDGPKASGTSDVKIREVREDHATNDQIIESLAEVEVLPDRSAGSVDQGQIARAAQGAASTNVRALPPGVDIFVEMHNAGFTDEQRKDPNIVRGAAEVYAASGGDKMMMHTAALTARALGTQTQEFGVRQVQVVQQMINAGYKPNQISAHDIHVAQMIVDNGVDTGAGPGGGYPTPQYVRMVADNPGIDRFAVHDPGYRQSFHVQQILNQLAQQRFAERHNRGGIDGYPRVPQQQGNRGII